jgi:molybdenum cofactor biosynthesis enzyme
MQAVCQPHDGGVRPNGGVQKQVCQAWVSSLGTCASAHLAINARHKSRGKTVNTPQAVMAQTVSAAAAMTMIKSMARDVTGKPFSSSVLNMGQIRLKKKAPSRKRGL